jgi:hypothetical protein
MSSSDTVGDDCALNGAVGKYRSYHGQKARMSGSVCRFLAMPVLSAFITPEVTAAATEANPTGGVLLGVFACAIKSTLRAEFEFYGHFS